MTDSTLLRRVLLFVVVATAVLLWINQTFYPLPWWVLLAPAMLPVALFSVMALLLLALVLLDSWCQSGDDLNEWDEHTD